MLVIVRLIFADELVGDGGSDSREHTPVSFSALFAWAVIGLVMELGQLLLDSGPLLHL